MAAALTPKQIDAWRTIRRLIARSGYPPTVRELALALGCQPNNAHQFLRALERKGYLRRGPGARGLELVEEMAEGVSVPIVGTIAAGEPIEALAEDAGALRLGREIVGSSGTYVLRVRGSSMLEDHILEGDLVLVRPQPTAENGEVVVALLPDGTATLKRIYRDGDRVRLQPANAAYQPIFVEPATLRIQGKVIGLLRPNV